MKLACLDFETANNHEESICAAGLVVFEDGQLTKSCYWLVRPPKGFGWFWDGFIAVHGIRHTDVLTAPEFSAIAPELFAYMGAADVVVAHNAQFDVRMLRGTVAHFGLRCPAFEYVCTCRVAKRVWPNLPNHQLDTVVAHIGHQFRHHQAQDDAEAAGRVLLAAMQQVGASNLSELQKALGLEAQCFSTER